MTSTTTAAVSRSDSSLTQVSRVDVLTGLALMAVAVFSRLPFTEKILYHWDSINFALSITRFDVWQGQPHVPGYILYVALARLANLVAGSPERALVLIAVAGSAMAVPALYFLGKEMFGRTVGLLAALFLTVSPLFWFYGEIALPHALDTFVVILAVWMLYRLRGGDSRMAVPAAVWLALAGGFRPQTQLFLMPLAIYAGWHLGWKRILAALAVMALVDVAWLAPLLVLSGGVSRYLEIMGGFTDSFNSTTSLFSGGGAFGLARNLTKLSMYTLYGWGLAVLPAALGFWMEVARIRQQGLRRRLTLLGSDTRTWFLVLWIAPVLAYYILVHMGQQGLVFVFLPALLLLSAVSIPEKWLLRADARLGLTALMILSAAIFLFAPANPLGSDGFKLLTHQAIQQHDAFYNQRLESVNPETFPPENTLILSSEWRFPQYYLPDYAFEPYTIGEKWEINSGKPTLGDVDVLTPEEIGVVPGPKGFVSLIIFDPELLPFLNAGNRQMEPVGGVEGLWAVRLKAGEALQMSPGGIEIVSR